MDSIIEYYPFFIIFGQENLVDYIWVQYTSCLRLGVWERLTIRTKNPVSAAFGTDNHRRRTGDVHGRSGSNPQFSLSYAGNLRPQRPRASYSKQSFASNWLRDSGTRCFPKRRLFCTWTLAANAVDDSPALETLVSSICLLFFHGRNGLPSKATFSSAM